MTVKKFLLISIVLLVCACREEKRYDINSDDKIPPAAPVISGYEALNGAARIFFTPPADEDIISVEARYTRTSDGDVFRFSTSYFSNSILIPGLADTTVYDIHVYAVDRAGNHSTEITYPVKPLESAILKVKNAMIIKGGFDAVFAKWTNELREAVNVFVDYTFTLNGTTKSLTRVFTSSDRDNWYYITDLVLPTDSPIKVKYRVSDGYGNITESVEMDDVFVLKDVELPKFDIDRNPLWSLPEGGSTPLAELGNNVVQVKGNQADGIFGKVIDGMIDMNENLNYMFSEAGGPPWSLMIDLGEEYELSRIITHQRHTWKGSADDEYLKRGGYYRSSNIQRYRMYFWDKDENRWAVMSEHTIPVPYGTLSELEWNKLGRAGDMAYMYPDNPQYSKPARWFRYEALMGFGGGVGDYCLSEITLYAKQK
jgi:hypothetical protein